MHKICDKENINYPTDGTAAVAARMPIIVGEKKGRRKRKSSAVTYTADKEKNIDKASGEVTEESASPEENESVGSGQPQPECLFGEGITTEVEPEEKPVPVPQTEGIVYEIAEDLYRREKTQAELEALCQPPFHKKFTDGEKYELDRESEEQTRHLLNSAREQIGEPAFLPEGLYDERDKPISTAAAFRMMIFLLIPGVNIIAAVYYSFASAANRNKRAMSRAFLLGSLLVMSVLLIMLTVYYVRSELRTPGSDLLAVWNRIRK